jgi:hypothetical protein
MKKKTKLKQSISLAPLAFNEAIRATLATGKAPPPPKRKPKGKGKFIRAFVDYEIDKASRGGMLAVYGVDEDSERTELMPVDTKAQGLDWIKKQKKNPK